MNILLASDGSSYARHAAHFLVNHLRSKEPISLTVLTSFYRPEDLYSGSEQAWFPEWREREKTRIESDHKELGELLGTVVASVETVQAQGSPAQGILRQAEKMKADMIVLGARGHSMVGRLLLGSVSDTVATHAECSVLVVRGEEKPPESDQACRMTIAYDGSAGSREAISELTQFEWAKDTSMHLVSVVPTFDFFAQGQSSVLHDHYKSEIERVREENQQLVTRLSSIVTSVDMEVTHGEHVGDTILKRAAANGSNLIMVGDTGHGLIGEWILGSSTKYVLRHAPCSVWISRHHRRVEQPDPSQVNATNAS